MENEEIVGKKYGRLLVLQRNGSTPNHSKQYLCLCDCGKKKNVAGYHLKNGDIKSCGCLGRERSKERATKHGMKNTRLYNIWCCMKTRCNCETDYHYKWYGAKGVKVCDEWENDFMSFYNWAMATGYTEELTIDRVDVNGNYEPSNCRWVDIKTQCRNRTSNHYYTYKGETKTIVEWSEEKGIPYNLLHLRIYRNVSEERIFSKEKLSNKENYKGLKK